MKVLVLGKGALGTRLAAALPGASLGDVDITDRARVLELIDIAQPDAVINAAGKTGRPNVDWCELHREETYRANVVGALNVADACQAHGVYLMHLGSGCVFGGPSPSPGGWREDDHANPIGFYARTKYAADLVLERLPRVAIVRLRMVIDATPSPRNMITRLASYRSVIDVENSVTVGEDFIAAVGAILDRRGSGIFHVTNPGTIRHRDLLELYREHVDPTHRVEFIRADELLSRGLAIAPRSNCILASSRLAELGIQLRPIDVALRDCMVRYGAAVRANSR